MSLLPYKNYGKILRESETGPGKDKIRMGMTNERSWRQDPGGWSYGMYQLATFGHRLSPGPVIVGPKSDAQCLKDKSPFHSFLEWGIHLGDDKSQALHVVLSGGKPKSLDELVLIAAGVSGGKYIDNKSFRDNFAKFAVDYPEWSEELQSGFHARSYYWPAHAELKKFGIDLTSRSEALNQFITDYANIGLGHFSNVMKKIKLTNAMSDKDILIAIAEAYRVLFDRFGDAQPVFAAGWANRFGSARTGKKGKVEIECLKML